MPAKDSRTVFGPIVVPGLPQLPQSDTNLIKQIIGGIVGDKSLKDQLYSIVVLGKIVGA